MKAVGYTHPGSLQRADALLDLELPTPLMGPRDLLVRIKAVSVNPVDVKVRAHADAPPGIAKVLGFDAAGVVEEVGPEVKLFRAGDEVYYAGDLTCPGTNAELHVVDERIVGHKPRSLDWAAAAALPLTTLTAWELLFDRFGAGRETKGSLLIINGAGGVGSVLIQLARKLTGLTVVATASRPDTVEWVKKLGAQHVIDHHKPLVEGAKAVGFEAFDYIASLTASDRNRIVLAELIAPQGKLALIDDPDTFDIVPFKRKCATVSWEFMFARSMFHTPDMDWQGRILNDTARLIDQGVLRTTLTHVETPINAATLKKVHGFVESGRSIGKTVLVGF